MNNVNGNQKVCPIFTMASTMGAFVAAGPASQISLSAPRMLEVQPIPCLGGVCSWAVPIMDNRQQVVAYTCAMALLPNVIANSLGTTPHGEQMEAKRGD